jgi:hypothetical protein
VIQALLKAVRMLTEQTVQQEYQNKMLKLFIIFIQNLKGDLFGKKRRHGTFSRKIDE